MVPPEPVKNKAMLDRGLSTAGQLRSFPVTLSSDCGLLHVSLWLQYNGTLHTLLYVKVRQGFIFSYSGVEQVLMLKLRQEEQLSSKNIATFNCEIKTCWEVELLTFWMGKIHAASFSEILHNPNLKNEGDGSAFSCEENRYERERKDG